MTMKHLHELTCLLGLATVLVALPSDLYAQRMKHGSGGNRSSASRPRATGGGAASRERPAAQSTRQTARPAQRSTINGGSKRSPERSSGKDVRGGNTVKGGNKVNIGSGNTNVNINVDNSRHTTVRRNTNIRYNRPPYRYGGRRYYAVRPYYYHPYRPFYWGPAWHPWGFFVATLATTAIIVSVNNQQYHYDNGVYYVPGSNGYTVVQAPVGATVTTLPSNSQTVVVNETTNNYYYGGTYYEKSDKGYTVVPPTAGTVVENLPEGGEEVKIGDQTYVKYGETYYQPAQRDGKNVYEVVDVQEGEG
jgi:hypothetical protein